MVERKTLNLVVAGSIPAGGVLYKNLSFLVCKNFGKQLTSESEVAQR